MDGPKCSKTLINSKLLPSIKFSVLKLDKLPIWLSVTISTTIAVIVGIIARFFIVPWQREKILAQSNELNDPSMVEISLNDERENVLAKIDEDKDENLNRIFHLLQILASVFSSFAHGGNDVR